MPWGSRDTFHLSPGYQPLMRQLGLDAQAVFSHPDIRVWRSIPERENATLDGLRDDGTPFRWHIKRFRPLPGGRGLSPAQREAEGIALLQQAQIPTVPLVGYGTLADGRSFLICEDLAGYRAADKLPLPPEPLVDRLADLAARLHAANLHHRDLYLCHFFVRADLADVRLIDAGRVRRLPRWPLRKRWVVKDLAQVRYAMLDKQWPGALWQRFLARYAAGGGYSVRALTGAIDRKTQRIARHDRHLRRAQPLRNVSLPDSRGILPGGDGGSP